MRNSNNAIKFLLAQYRAIFKRAYIKGLASAVLLTAGLAAGQAQAAEPTSGLDNDNDFYYFNAATGQKWSESNAQSFNNNGIVAGAIGGDGLKNADSSLPEKDNFDVTGGKLTIDGKGTDHYSLASGTKVAAAGAWAESTTQTINAHDNEVKITGTGYIANGDDSLPGTRGAVFGAWASSTKGQAIASSNHITVENRTDATSRAAASHGFTGAHAQGHKGATASGNTVDISGTAKERQLLSLSGGYAVAGGFVKALADGTTSGTGTYTIADNKITLTDVQATAGASEKMVIAGGHLLLDKADATKTSMVAQGNTVDITGANFTLTGGNDGSGIRGAQSDVEGATSKVFKSTTFSNNSVKLTDTTISLDTKNMEIVGAHTNTDGVATLSSNSVELTDSKILAKDGTDGYATVKGAAVGGSGATFTASQNSVKITGKANKDDSTANKFKSNFIAGADIVSTYSDTKKEGKIAATGNSVEIGSDVVIDVTSATNSVGITGASVSAAGDKLASLDMSNNSVTIGGKVQGNVFAARFVNSASGFDTDSTVTFLNNDVTLKTGGEVKSGSLVGGTGKDSVIAIENGSTYIVNNGTQDIASDVINIAGNVKVEANNTLEISGFYQNGDVNASNFHDNLTTIASSAVIENANQITIYGKAVVDQGAKLTGTIADSKIVVNAAHGLATDSKILLKDEDKVAGADQGTLAIYKGTLQSYLMADNVLSQTTKDNAGYVQLTSGGVLEFRDTTNIDIAEEFDFNTNPVAGSIMVDEDSTGKKGSIIRGNELTVSHMLATNATSASTDKDLDPATTAGINIEANVLHLGANDLKSADSEKITFNSATFRDQLSFDALNNGKTPEGDINDGYHLVSQTIGDHYRVVKTQGESLEDQSIITYYEAQDGVIEGNATITATTGDSGELVVRNGNYTADGALTIASGGTLSVGGKVDLNGDGTDDTLSYDPNGEYSMLNAPDATLVLGQELTFDLSKGSAEVKVEGAQQVRYDAEAAAETLGDDRHVVLDLRPGVTILDDDDHNINGKATLNVTSGGEILLTATTVNSLLAQNNGLTNTGSGSFLTASSGGAFVVEGDVEATFDDFSADGSTHGISLANKGYFVADSLTIDNYGASGTDMEIDEAGSEMKFQTVDWGDGTVAVQDLEISDNQLTTGDDKPNGANSYASYVTLAQGTAEIGSYLFSLNHTLKLGAADGSTSGNIVFETDDAKAEGKIDVNHIQVDKGYISAKNGVWDGAATDVTLSGANTSLSVYGNIDDNRAASLTLNNIDVVGDSGSVTVDEAGSLKAVKLTLGNSSSTLTVNAYGQAEFDQVNFSDLGAAADDADFTKDAPVSVRGYLKINGDADATIAQGDTQVDDPNNGVILSSEDDSIRVFKNGTLEFGEAAVNGAILDTTTTKDFNGAASITAALDNNYSKITNRGGTVKLDFASGVVFDADAIQALKEALFTEGSFTGTTNVLTQGGILHINDATFEGLEGKLTALEGEGLDGWTGSWDVLKEFSDIKYNGVVTNQTLHTNVSEIAADDQVQGNWGSLSMVSTGVSSKSQVQLVGDTSLNYAAGNNGFFISDANRQIALGAKVAGHRTFTLVDGGKIGTVSLSAAENVDGHELEQETVLEVTSSADNTNPALTTIAEIKGEGAGTNHFAQDTVVNFRADAEVTNGITGIEDVIAFTGADVKIKNTTAVGELSTENGSITVAETAQFGESYVFGGSITVQQDAKMDDALGSDTASEIAVINGGNFTVSGTLTADEKSEIRVGIDVSAANPDEITLSDGSLAGGTGYLQVGTLELNGGTLVVDPEYTEATSIAAVGKFKDGKQSYQYDNDKGILNGDLLIGKNAAFGLGATVEDTQAAIAQFQVGNALDPEKYGSILYLNGQLDVKAGSHIALNSSDTAKTDDDILGVNIYNVSSEGTEVGSTATDRYAALGLGKNTAIIMTNQAFEDDKGEKTGTAIYFNRTNAVVNGLGGEIVLAGDFDLSDKLNIFQDKDAAGQEGVDVKGEIKVKTLNGFLYTTLKGDNQGYQVNLEVNKPEAYGIMSEASDPVVETLIAYGVGVTGGSLSEGADQGTDTPADNPADTPAADNGAGTQGNGTAQVAARVTTEPETIAEPAPEADPAPETQTAAKSSFLERVIVNTHGAPAEQAARLGVYGGAAQVGLAAAGSNSDVLESRFGIGANAQSLNLASNGMGGTLWVAPIYKSSDSDDFGAQGLNYGVDFDLYGVALGGDYKVTNEITVGAMFNVGSGSLDGQGNAAAAGTSNDFDYFGFALYGAYQAGALTVTGDLSYTQVDNDLEGSNEVGKLTASSDTSAWSLGVTGQYKFSFAAVDVTPHAGLRFTSLDLDDYSLEAAGYGNVANYDGDTLSVFSIPVGVTFAKTIEGESWNVTPALDLHVTGQFGDDEAEGTVAWSGTNLSTNVSSEIFDSFTYGATVGVQAESNSFSFGVGLGYTGSSNTDEFSAQANARFTF